MYPFESEQLTYIYAVGRDGVTKHMRVPRGIPTEVLLEEQAYALACINKFGRASQAGVTDYRLRQRVRSYLAPIGTKSFNYGGRRMAIHLVRLSKEIYERQMSALLA